MCGIHVLRKDCDPNLKMLIEAIRSLSRRRSQYGQLCIIFDRSFSTISPHSEHMRDVFLGSISSTYLPAPFALSDSIVLKLFRATSTTYFARQWFLIVPLTLGSSKIIK